MNRVKENSKKWVVPLSKCAENTFNPIRNVVDTMNLEPNPELELIKLTVGDPSIYGNLPANERCVEAFCNAVKSGYNNGYVLAHGTKEARDAVAKYCSTPEVSVTGEDVILSSGCSGAVEMAIEVLADPGDNILIPRPGFSLYRCLSNSRGLKTKFYDLIPEKYWEVDLEHLESLIDDRTRIIVIINPSNPCGSVYTKEHLQAIHDVAAKHQVPILSDEVYAFCTFGDRPFYSMGVVSNKVPVLVVGGIAKRFLVPGWRLGWVVIFDKNDAFGSKITEGLKRLSQRILGPTTPLQTALPVILSECTPEFFNKTLCHMKRTSDIFLNNLGDLPELNPIRSYGAMYMLIGVNIDKMDNIKSGVDFAQRLIEEQSVFCLPAECFEYANYVRVVLTCCEDKVQEACERIVEFCKKHRKSAA